MLSTTPSPTSGLNLNVTTQHATIALRDLKDHQMKVLKTKRFQNFRFNFWIDYHQFQMPVIDDETGERTLELFHEERVYYIGLTDICGYTIQWGKCKDTADYYRQ